MAQFCSIATNYSFNRKGKRNHAVGLYNPTMYINQISISYTFFELKFKMKKSGQIVF